MEQIIDQAVKDFLDSLGQAQEEFLSDIKELEDQGLSLEEIMIALGALSIADYFLEDLGMQVAVNTYLSSTDALLDDLFKFGKITESQLLALRKTQESAIIAYTNRLGSQMQLLMIQGVSNNLSTDEMRKMMQRNSVLNSKQVDRVVGDTLAIYRRSVTAAMLDSRPPGEKLWYGGPLDNKTRPICRKMLAEGQQTQKQVKDKFPGALQDGGGLNCRHEWLPLTSTNERITTMRDARASIAAIAAHRKKKGLKSLKYLTFQQYSENS